MDLSKLRARLQEITSNNDIDGHRLAIETLRLKLPHTIRLVSLANPALPQNCFAWALGLNHELAHWVGEWGLPELFTGSKFMQELFHYLVPIPEGDATEGDLVIYFDAQVPTHAGLIKDSRVCSKWGKGHIYHHNHLEVPASYGNTIRYFPKLPDSVASTRFAEYVRHHPDYSIIQELFEAKFGNLH